jgi:type II secretory pathway pseudopilin PulG
MIVLAGIGLLVSAALPRLFDARKAANETSAKATLRAIYVAQDMYREGDKNEDMVMDFASSLEALYQTKLVDDVVGSGEEHGYRFEILPSGNFKYAWSAPPYPATPASQAMPASSSTRAAPSASAPPAPPAPPQRQPAAQLDVRPFREVADAPHRLTEAFVAPWANRRA